LAVIGLPACQVNWQIRRPIAEIKERSKTKAQLEEKICLAAFLPNHIFQLKSFYSKLVKLVRRWSILLTKLFVSQESLKI
jgi:hypothetical protein